MNTPIPTGHTQKMAWKYRHARWLYDLSRKFFLAGRSVGMDHLGLPAHAPVRVLEIGCGTGRNMHLLLRKYPQARVDGVDIAEPMLAAAQRKVGSHRRARLAHADACDPLVGNTFDAEGYDGVLMSYSLSMVPDWSLGLRCALGGLRIGGRLSVVDFGCFEGWGAFGPVAIESLARHDAPPMLGLKEEALLLDPLRWQVEHASLYGGLVQTLVVTRLG